jgi:hypothetical protein
MWKYIRNQFSRFQCKNYLAVITKFSKKHSLSSSTISDVVVSENGQYE